VRICWLNVCIAVCFFFTFTSYELWRSHLIIPIICWIETDFYTITVFPHHRVFPLAMPGRYSLTFRYSIKAWVILGLVWGRPEIEPSPCLVRHNYKTHDLTNHANTPHMHCVKISLSCPDTKPFISLKNSVQFFIHSLGAMPNGEGDHVSPQFYVNHTSKHTLCWSDFMQ
jgi:hypothetical protein